MRDWAACTIATTARPEIRRFPLAYTSWASVGSSAINSAINKEQLAPTQHLRPRTQPISCRETLFRTTLELNFDFCRAKTQADRYLMWFRRTRRGRVLISPHD